MGGIRGPTEVPGLEVRQRWGKKGGKVRPGTKLEVFWWASCPANDTVLKDIGYYVERIPSGLLFYVLHLDGFYCC